MAFYVITPGGTYTSFASLMSAKTLKPGDVVEFQALVPGGIWIDQEPVAMAPNGSGVFGNMITIRGRAGDTIIIDGNYTLGNCLAASNVNYLMLLNLTFQNHTGLSATGFLGQSGCVQCNEGAGWVIKNCTVNVGFDDGQMTGVYPRVIVPRRGIIQINSCPNWTLINNRVNVAKGPWSGESDSMFVGSANLWVQGNYLQMHNTYMGGGSLIAVGVPSRGTGYQVGDILTLINDGVAGHNGSGSVYASGCTAQVVTIDQFGGVLMLSLLTGGVNYAQGLAWANGGHGSGCVAFVYVYADPQGQLGPVRSVNVPSKGIGYQVNDVVFLTSNTGTPPSFATLLVTQVDTQNGISHGTLQTAGSGYIQGLFSATTGGNGSGAYLFVNFVAGGGAANQIYFPSQGSGYQTGDVLTVIAPPGDEEGQIVITAIGTNGQFVSGHVLTHGGFYTSPVTVTGVTGGHGTGAVLVLNIQVLGGHNDCYQLESAYNTTTIGNVMDRAIPGMPSNPYNGFTTQGQGIISEFYNQTVNAVAMLSSGNPPTLNFGGSGFQIGDILQLNQYGGGGLVQVTSLSGANHAVSGITLLTQGGNYYPVNGTSTAIGGHGTGAIFNFQSVTGTNISPMNFGYAYFFNNIIFGNMGTFNCVFNEREEDGLTQVGQVNIVFANNISDNWNTFDCINCDQGDYNPGQGGSFFCYNNILIIRSPTVVSAVFFSGSWGNTFPWGEYGSTTGTLLINNNMYYVPFGTSSSQVLDLFVSTTGLNTSNFISYTWAQWQKSGWDVNGIGYMNGINGWYSPQFIYPSNNINMTNYGVTTGFYQTAQSFQLQPGSLGVGSGMNLSQYFTTDFFGNPRPAIGAWDIGPFQQNITTPSSQTLLEGRVNASMRR